MSVPPFPCLYKHTPWIVARGLLPRRAWFIPVLTPITVFLLRHTRVQACTETQTGREEVRGKKSKFSSKKAKDKLIHLDRRLSEEGSEKAKRKNFKALNSYLFFAQLIHTKLRCANLFLSVMCVACLTSSLQQSQWCSWTFHRSFYPYATSCEHNTDTHRIRFCRCKEEVEVESGMVDYQCMHLCWVSRI